MEHSKSFYESAIRVLDHLAAGNSFISDEDGQRVAGDYWAFVADYLDERKIARKVMGGCVRSNIVSRIPSARVECQNFIDEINKAEHDRELRNKESLENIMYGRKGYRVSLIAIALSAIAIVIEICRLL